MATIILPDVTHIGVMLSVRSDQGNKISFLPDWPAEHNAKVRDAAENNKWVLLLTDFEGGAFKGKIENVFDDIWDFNDIMPVPEIILNNGERFLITEYTDPDSERSGSFKQAWSSGEGDELVKKASADNEQVTVQLSVYHFKAKIKPRQDRPKYWIYYEVESNSMRRGLAVTD